MTTPGIAGKAAEIKVFCSTSSRAVMKELVPQFERETGHKISISFGPAKIMLERIAGGETADVAILSAPAINTLTKQGKILPGSSVQLGRCRIGLAVRAGAPRPDISSVEAFKQTLLNAKSIAHTSSGISGMHFSGLIERLGIGEEIRAKAKTQPGGLVGELAAKGDAELAVQQIPELKAVPGVDVVGALPQELQVVTVITAAVFSSASHPDAARAFLAFLSTPAAAHVFDAKGFETG